MDLYRKTTAELVQNPYDVEDMHERLRTFVQLQGKFSNKTMLALFRAAVKTKELYEAIQALDKLADDPLLRGVWEGIAKRADGSINDATFQENLEKLVADIQE